MGKGQTIMKKTKSKNKEQAETTPFEKAVRDCPEISNGFRSGLSALKKGEASKIKAKDTKLLHGSVDIDKETSALYPDDARWDYAIGYDSLAYFVEIHPAFTSEVKTMLNKKAWLENWLSAQAEDLNRIRKSVHWIFTEKFAILKNSPQYRQLVQKGLVPTAELKLQ